MSIHIRENPELPLLVMYNIYTDQLGISAEGFELVAITNLIPFVKYLPYEDDFEQYEGGALHELAPLDTGHARRIGYVKHEGMVEKSDEWQCVGEL